MISLTIAELDDRWVVNARRAIVSGLVASQSALRMDLDSGLSIEVAGSWRATAGSPITGRKLEPRDLKALSGSRVLSLVLFATGSIRIVLSGGVTVVAKSSESSRVAVALPRVFSWTAEAQSVDHWRADAGNDG